MKLPNYVMVSGAKELVPGSHSSIQSLETNWRAYLRRA